MEKEPHIFYDVSYEGNGFDQEGCPLGDGTWLYMRPSWYCGRSDCGTIHEHTIRDVIDCAKNIYQDKQRWVNENSADVGEVKNVLAGKYDR